MDFTSDVNRMMLNYCRGRRWINGCASVRMGRLQRVAFWLEPDEVYVVVYADCMPASRDLSELMDDKISVIDNWRASALRKHNASNSIEALVFPMDTAVSVNITPKFRCGTHRSVLKHGSFKTTGLFMSLTSFKAILGGDAAEFRDKVIKMHVSGVAASVKNPAGGIVVLDFEDASMEGAVGICRDLHFIDNTEPLSRPLQFEYSSESDSDSDSVLEATPCPAKRSRNVRNVAAVADADGWITCAPARPSSSVDAMPEESMRTTKPKLSVSFASDVHD